MPLNTAQLAGQVLIAGFPGAIAPPPLVESTQKGELGGIILFKRNLGAPAEVAGLIASFVDAAPEGLPLMVAVDQEGGRVARLGSPVLRLPAMRKLAATGDVGLIEDAGRHLGRQLRAIGFTMDFAPVLDVDTNPDNPVIGDRSFGRSADEVIRYAFAFARGLEEAGIASCGKHFPGHGDTDLDSHLALPKLALDRQRLDSVELPPFRAARGVLPALMSAHVVFDSVEPGLPATLSHRAMTGLLRHELGWDGVTISDDLEMKAVADHHSVESLAVGAIRAGCDALLVCSDLERLARAREALRIEAEKDASFRARLSDAADRHIRMRLRYPSHPVVDAEKLAAALDPTTTAAIEARIERAIAEIPA